MDQRHLMLKGFHKKPYGHKKKVFLEKNISIISHSMELGYFMLYFTTFYNVSIWVKWPQRLVHCNGLL